MEAIEAIFTRHTINNLRPDPIPRALVEQLLAAAVQAPNHYKLRPWRFVVVQGAARERLGRVFAELLRAQQPDIAPAALEKERAKALRAPLLIAIGVDRSDDPRSKPEENLCAAAAACENLLLAAHALGLEGIWLAHRRTGSGARRQILLGAGPLPAADRPAVPGLPGRRPAGCPRTPVLRRPHHLAGVNHRQAKALAASDFNEGSLLFKAGLTPSPSV